MTDTWNHFDAVAGKHGDDLNYLMNCWITCSQHQDQWSVIFNTLFLFVSI